MGELIGYARVSTADQRATLQHDALTAAGCARIFTDHVSGSVGERSGLAHALEYIRTGDTLVVWRLDRLGRSLKHLIEVVGTLEERSIGFMSLQESIDTTTAGGKLTFHLFGALAEFERGLIRERTRAGLAAARARGRKGGRRSVLTAEKVAIARQMYASREHTVATIGQTLGVSRSTVYRCLRPSE